MVTGAFRTGGHLYQSPIAILAMTGRDTLGYDRTFRILTQMDHLRTRIRLGEVIKVRLAPIERQYRVKELTDKRMSAPLAVNFVEDITPQEQFDLLNAARAYGFEYREKGSGRPTKRDRRMIDRMKNYEED